MTDVHPALDGRQNDMARLADVVRRLIELTVTNRAPAGELAPIVAALDEAAERLGRHVPDDRPTVTWMNSSAMRSRAPGGMSEHMAFDVVVGRYSPLALPVTLEFEPPRAIGRGVFSAPYEGPPGCVHGAVIAATFDIVLTAANIIGDAAGPTVKLETRFRRPTLLYEEAVFDAWIDRRDGDRTFTVGRLTQRGVVTVEARGEFAAIDPRLVEKLSRRRGVPPAT